MFLKKTHILLVIFVFFFAQLTFSQQKISLAQLLDNLSNTHNIYFTYKSNLLKNRYIDELAYKNLSLKKSIDLIKKTSELQFDYLGNNYYVIYIPTTKNITLPANKKSLDSTSVDVLDSKITQKNKNFILEGVVVNQNNTPLAGVNITELNTKNGTISSNDGTFSLKLISKNNIEFSYIGYETQEIKSTSTYQKIVFKEGMFLDEIQVVGSRNKNRTKIDAPIATDVIDIEKTTKNSGLTEVNDLLQFAVPSFNATKQSGADGADHIVPATYRGLGPDQTLVLINGKRRHQASLINLYGTRGRGNSGTDLNAIPTTAIQRIEILKDGASAQYGSDAIAGVINIVLKEDTNILNANTTFGFYNASKSNINKGVDGLTYKVAVNYGTKINKNGFVNISTEFLAKNHTFRESTPQRQKYGDAAQKNISLFFNAEIPITNQSSFYAFGGYNHRNSEAFAFTRARDNERNVLEIYPDGFNPLITSSIADKSFSLGFKTVFKKWNIDFNNTFGNNNFKYIIKKTVNATLLENSPKEFDAGGHQLSQNTTSVDFSKYLPKQLEGINIAFGLEHRLENYKIFSGEEASYASYDVNGELVTSQTPTSNLNMYNGKVRPRGSQGFPGYSSENEVNRDRTNFSLYTDAEFDFTKKWMIGTALRYEYYNDFGGTLNTKLATRIKLFSYLNLKSSFSTGFRAPSLAQKYYNLTFTNYIDNVASESLLISNNDPITEKLNINKLKEEKAINASLGISGNFKDFTFSLDGYFVKIKDRIILSGNFDATSLGFNLDNVQFFANGVDTKTIGIDLKARWHKQFNNSKLILNFSGNINKMNIDKINNKDLDRETFFGIREQHFLLASAPKSKFNLGFNYQQEKISTGINITRFSSITLIDWQIQQDLSNFNNSNTDRISAATDYYTPKYTLDLHLSYNLLNYLTLQVGANNIFNTYPTTQNNNTDSGGLWDATQMGTNGAFYYSKLNLKF